MENVVKRVKRLWHWLRRTGPYLVVMVLLPGGTLLALALLLYRRGQLPMAIPTRAAIAVASLGRFIPALGARVR